MLVRELIEQLLVMESMGAGGEVSISVTPEYAGNDIETNHFRIFADEIIEVMENKGNTVIVCDETYRNFVTTIDRKEKQR